MYLVKQEKFEGPLDLLLELIQSQKLSINEISLAKVTDEFIEYSGKLAQSGRADLPAQAWPREIWEDQEALAEFLVIASTLLLIKSRSLLPQYQAVPEEEASIHELEERLRQYQRLKEAARDLGQMAAGGPKSFSRQAYAAIQPMFRPAVNSTPEMLLRAFEAVIAAIPKIEKLAEEKIKKIISLEEKIKELQSFLQKKVERAFSELIAGANEKIEVIVSFLAVLELAKQKLITLHQPKPFKEITMRRSSTPLDIG